MQLGTTVTRYLPYNDVFKSVPGLSLLTDQSICNILSYPYDLWPCFVFLVVHFLWNFILSGNCSIFQWAEVLSADAFSAFEDAGLDNGKVSWKQLCIRTGQVLQLT